MVGRKAMEKAILGGVQDANRKYEKWSRGGWLSDSGVEGHVVSTIVEKLHGLVSGNGSIEMEMSFGSIRKWSRAKNPPGRPRTNVKAPNRADIVVLSKEWRPVCVIEVKRFWQEEKCLKDLERIRDLILRCGREKNGLLYSGFLAFQLEGWKEEDMSAERCLESQAREVRQVLRDKFDNEGLKMQCRLGAKRHYPKMYRVLYNQTDWVHAAFCVGLWSR